MKYKIIENERLETVPQTEKRCLHETCSQCGGTGVRKDGLGSCVHMISCPRPRCNPCRM
jgi:hypothetical protein